MNWRVSIPVPVIQAIGFGGRDVKVVYLPVHLGRGLTVTQYADDFGQLMFALKIVDYLVEHADDLKVVGILRAQLEARQLQQRLSGGFARRQLIGPPLDQFRDAAYELSLIHI